MEDACLCQVGREKGSRSFAFGWPRVGELRGVMGFIIWAGPSITLIFHKTLSAFYIKELRKSYKKELQTNFPLFAYTKIRSKVNNYSEYNESPNRT
jgi:hypothetical protein